MKQIHKKLNIENAKKTASPFFEASDVSSAFVFGSYARGDANEKSDLDILITFSEPKSIIGRMKLANALSDALGKKVDLVSERSVSPYLRKEIYSHTIPFYEKRR